MQYWLNTTYACGLIETDNNGIIVWTCPIYKRWTGIHIEKLKVILSKRIIEIVKLT